MGSTESNQGFVFKLGLAQCCHPAGDGCAAVLELVDEWCARAAEQGVDLLVFPESLMTRYERAHSDFLEAAQPLDGPFSQGVCEIAAKHGLWVAYTVNEKSSDERPHNTVAICDDQGVLRGSYRKVHLFDTDFTRESDRMAPGDELFAPIETPFGKLGLSICYDLRFPEVARSAALQGCQLLINPAAWVAGPGKAYQWRTLLAARAIENEMFVAGVSRCDAADPDVSGTFSYIGQSCVFGPKGEILAEGGEGEELVVAEIDLSAIDVTRAAMPVFDHRHPELYV